MTFQTHSNTVATTDNPKPTMTKERVSTVTCRNMVIF